MQGSRQTVLLARRAPRINRWSLDARSEEQSAYPLGEVEESGGPRWTRAVGDQPAPPKKKEKKEKKSFTVIEAIRIHAEKLPRVDLKSLNGAH